MAPEMLVVLLACVLLVPGAAGFRWFIDSNLHINLCYSCDINCQNQIGSNEAYFDDVTEELKKRMDTLAGYRFTLHNTRVVEWPFRMNHMAAFVYGGKGSYQRLWYVNRSFWNFEIPRKGVMWQLFKDTFKCDVGVNMISTNDTIWKKDYLKCIKSASGGWSAGDREICRKSYITVKLDKDVVHVSSWIARSLGTLLGIYNDGYESQYNQARTEIWEHINYNRVGYAEQQLRYGFWKNLEDDCRGSLEKKLKWKCKSDKSERNKCIMFPYPNEEQEFSKCSKAYLDLHFLIVRIHPSKFPKACLEKKKDG